MSHHDADRPDPDSAADRLRLATTERNLRPAVPPVPNYSLAEVCPACDAPVYRRACKVRCTRCGFMWDCSEL